MVTGEVERVGGGRAEECSHRGGDHTLWAEGEERKQRLCNWTVLERIWECRWCRRAPSDYSAHLDTLHVAKSGWFLAAFLGGSNLGPL